MSDLYDSDTYTWAMRQADALRRRSANEIDWDNVADEIESVGETEARELRSRYVVLLAHLLKWLLQPDRRSPSWRSTIVEQRESIAEHLDANPGLKPRRDELFANAYRSARNEASAQMERDLELVPDVNPFTLAQAMDSEFWPDVA